MAKLTAFEPFFGMYLRTPVPRSVTRGSSLSARFASFTERERTYLAPKRTISFKLHALPVSPRHPSTA